MSAVVNSAAYANGKRVGEIPIEEVSEVLKQPDRFLWMGLHEADEALLKQVQGELGPRSRACRVVGGAPVGGAAPPDAASRC